MHYCCLVLLMSVIGSSSSMGRRALVALITGTSKGIGLGLTRLLLEKPLTRCSSDTIRVVACCRTGASAELQALQAKHGDRLVILPLDVRKEESHLAAKKQLMEVHGIRELDIIICNAGISNKDHPVDPFFDCKMEDMMDTFSTNALGSLFTLQQFAPLCMASEGKEKLCCVLSSRLASIEQNTTGGYTSYRASKACVNMIVKTFSEDKTVRDAGVKTLAIHPGWVKTDMGDRDGTRGAPLTVDDSSRGIFDLIETALIIQHGGQVFQSKFKNFIEDFRRSDKGISFVGYDGELLPW